MHCEQLAGSGWQLLVGRPTAAHPSAAFATVAVGTDGELALRRSAEEMSAACAVPEPPDARPDGAPAWPSDASKPPAANSADAREADVTIVRGRESAVGSAARACFAVRAGARSRAPRGLARSRSHSAPVGAGLPVPVLVGDMWQTACTVDYRPPPVESSAATYDVPVSCGDVKDTLRLAAHETTLSVRVYSDATMLEVFFQHGRAAMTIALAQPLDDDSLLALGSNAPIAVQAAAVYPLKTIWTSADAVRKQPRVYS